LIFNVKENEMATYDEIRDDVMDRHDSKYIQDCRIAHVKELNGLEPYPSHHRHSLQTRAKPCPNDMRPLIETPCDVSE
jgi:hypothetical protein